MSETDLEMEIATLKGDAAVMELLNRRCAEADARVRELDEKIATSEARSAEAEAYADKVRGAVERINAAHAGEAKPSQEDLDIVTAEFYRSRGMTPTPKAPGANVQQFMADYYKATGMDKLPGGRR